jgi:uncharacterized membrane protein
MSEMQGTSTAQDSGSGANLVYILYLVSLLVGVTSIVGVVVAYMYRASAPVWVQSHYQFQIRTFWICLLGAIVGWALTWVFGIGFLILLAVLIWYIVRCVKGMQYVGRREAYPNPQSWLW